MCVCVCVCVWMGGFRERLKRDKERWKEIKEGQKKPEIVVANKWEVERDGLGVAVVPKTSVALEKELKALKMREKDSTTMKSELERMTNEHKEALHRLALCETALKSERALLRVLSAKQSKGNPESEKSQKALAKSKKQAAQASESNAVLEATIEGLSMELEKSTVGLEELRVQFERTKLESARAVAQRDEVSHSAADVTTLCELTHTGRAACCLAGRRGASEGLSRAGDTQGCRRWRSAGTN